MDPSRWPYARTYIAAVHVTRHTRTQTHNNTHVRRQTPPPPTHLGPFIHPLSLSLSLSLSHIYIYILLLCAPYISASDKSIASCFILLPIFLSASMVHTYYVFGVCCFVQANTHARSTTHTPLSLAAEKVIGRHKTKQQKDDVLKFQQQIRAP